MKHLQSVVNEPASVQHPQLTGCQRHLVDVADSEEANLLRHLPAALAFVETALGSSNSSNSSGGGGSSGGRDPSRGSPSGSSPRPRVLIHCAQGVSRSAAVAAACLMARAPGELEPSAALAALQRRCPAAAPNPGFMAQLELFFAMSCCLQDSYIPYKRFLLAQVGGRWVERLV